MTGNGPPEKLGRKKHPRPPKPVGRGEGGGQASSRRNRGAATSPRDNDDPPGIRNPYVRFRKLDRPPLEPALTTLWEYPSQHYGKGEQGSSAYRGATPSWVIWQVIQRFTQSGDRVLDPFCGSGTTLDVCRDTQREGLGFDVAPFRADILAGDARELPLPNDHVQLAFLDPPYADNLVYSNAPNCIGKTRAQDGSYFDAMAQVFREMARVVRPGGHLALYVQDILEARGGKKSARFWPLGIELSRIAVAARFEMVDHVCVVRRNKDLQNGAYRKAASEQEFFLRGFNHLLLFQKPGTEAKSSAVPKRQNRPARSRPSPPRNKR